MSRVPAISVIVVLALSPLAGQTRTLESEGVSLTLPAGWIWAEDDPESFQATKELSVEGARGLISCDLETPREPFAGNLLNGLRDSVQREPTLFDFKLEENRKLAGASGVYLVSYVQRQEDRPPVLVRKWVVERIPHRPLVWTEAGLGELSEAPEAAWPELRKGLKLGRPQGDKPQRKRGYVQQKTRFTLPKGWAWDQGPRGPKVNIDDTKSVLLFGIRTCIVEEGRGYGFWVFLSSVKSNMTPDQFIERNTEVFTGEYDDLQDRELADARLHGRKAVRLSFTGIRKGGQGSRLRRDIYALKYKGRMFVWVEVVEQPTCITPKMRKMVRKGLRLG